VAGKDPLFKIRPDKRVHEADDDVTSDEASDESPERILAGSPALIGNFSGLSTQRPGC